MCTKESQVDGEFTCFRDSGSQYHGTPLVSVRDEVKPGILVATTRLLLGADVALGEQLALGARFGYVLRGDGPAPDGGKDFIPFHAEARVSQFFGPSVYGSSVTPYAFLAAGLAQVDSHIDVDVVEDPNAPPPPNQPDNPPEQQLDVYKKMGPWFGGLGAGLYVPVMSNQGPTFELLLMQLFPSNGTAFSLGIGYALGV